MLYSLIRQALFHLEPERAHALALRALQFASTVSGQSAGAMCSQPVPVLGLRFLNRVGVAAGLDKDGRCIDGLGALGFGFIEVGTVTPRAQAGNPRPRLFRVPRAEGIINRMGFPNPGVANVMELMKGRRYRGVCGINIGKNADTPIDDAWRDYVACLEAAGPYADYVALNISSPNTADLRKLQGLDHLGKVLDAVLDKRDALLGRLGRALPVLVKISPDMTDAELSSLASVLLEFKVDGVIATNTTVQRPLWDGLAQDGESGGLSGRPLHSLSLRTVARLRALLGPTYPIIGVGGIASATDAVAMIDAGADLIQLYTGFIYRGPELVREIVRALRPA